MLSEKKKMKDLLCEGLFLLMQEKPFEKITIKQICDRTGVIRGTFYNHFMDKYEALEYLVYSMLFEDEEHLDVESTIKDMFNTIYLNQDFFRSCFRITGQNGFEELLSKIFESIFDELFDLLDFSELDPLFTRKFLVEYYSNNAIYFFRKWVKENFKTSCEDYYKLVHTTFKNSLIAFKVKRKN